MTDQIILSGYRIGLLNANSYEGALAKSVGASLLHIYRDAPSTSQAEFATFWNQEVQRAQVDGMSLVVMKNRYGARTPFHPFLDSIEENEWQCAEKPGRLRFVSDRDLMKTIRGESDGGLLYDSWGDAIQRGWKGLFDDDSLEEELAALPIELLSPVG